MTCILINAWAKTVSQVDIPLDYKAFQALVVAEYITPVYPLTNSDHLYVDEEADLHRPPPPSFTINGSIYRGNAVVVRCNDNGEDITPHSSLPDIKSVVSFE